MIKKFLLPICFLFLFTFDICSGNNCTVWRCMNGDRVELITQAGYGPTDEQKKNCVYSVDGHNFHAKEFKKCD